MEKWFLVLSPLIGSGLVIIFLRLWIGALTDQLKAIAKRMDCFEQSQHACQLDVAKTYATRAEVQEIDAKVDNLGNRVTRLESTNAPRV